MSRIIIDTREQFEYQAGHVEGAINIPPATFMTGIIPKELEGVSLDTEIILYCRSGSRSNVVGHILRSFGFTHIVNGVNQGHVEKLIGQKP